MSRDNKLKMLKPKTLYPSVNCKVGIHMKKNAIDLDGLWEEVRGESGKELGITLSSKNKEELKGFLEYVIKKILDEAMQSTILDNRKRIVEEDIRKAIKTICIREEKL